MRILIAEDDRISCRLLQATLTKGGYEVIIATDGQEAWNVLQQPDAPRLAILDWMMPGIDGVHICREVRKKDHWPYTYILLLTAKNRKQDLVEGLNSGADDYITKPFDAEELNARLRAAGRIIDLQEKLFTAQATLQDQATHDALTGLPNRVLFNERLTHMLAEARRYDQTIAVMYMDLDHFKLINDTFGHNSGDMLLKQVSARLTDILREMDTVCRMGGDEFTLLLSHITEPKDAALVAEKIISEFRRPFRLEDCEVSVSTSIGIVIYPSDGSDAETLLKRADTAMYRAKEKGRNRYHFYCESLNVVAA